MEPPPKRLKAAPFPAPLEAGATPAVGVDLVGYVDGPNTGIHDPLWARAVAFRGGGQECAVIITLDLLGIELELSREIRSVAAAKLDGQVAPENVLVQCTHNHSGPSLLRFYGEPPADSDVGRDTHHVHVDPAYERAAVAAAVAVAVEAYRALRPATLRAGATTVQGVAANRRAVLDDGSVMHFSGLYSNTAGRWRGRAPPPRRTVAEAGAFDPELVALCAADASTGEAIAVLSNYACHPWIYDGTRVSSEIPGATVDWIEAQLQPDSPGVVALYCPGAGSDITCVQHQAPAPLGRVKSPDNAEEKRAWDAASTAEREAWFGAERLRFGELLGSATLRALEADATGSSVGGEVAAGVRPVTLPCYPRPRESASPGLRDMYDDQVLANGGKVSSNRLAPAEHRLETEVHVIELGDVCIVGLPSEVYVDYGIEIKRRSRHKHTLVLSYVADYFGDIVTHEAVAERCCPELDWTKIHPDARRVFMEALERELEPVA